MGREEGREVVRQLGGFSKYTYVTPWVGMLTFCLLMSLKIIF